MFGKWQERHRGAATLDGREHERVNRQGVFVEVQQSEMSGGKIRSFHVIIHRQPKGRGGFNIQMAAQTHSWTYRVHMWRIRCALT